jgi:predicted amidohydrolase YtcJ
MYTIWGARLSFDDDNRGTLSEGKIADFVVLNKNHLLVDQDKLKEIKVIDIYLKGRPYDSSIKKPFDLCVEAIKNRILR